MTRLMLDVETPHRRPPLLLTAAPFIVVDPDAMALADQPTAQLVLEPYGVILLTAEALDTLAAQALTARARLP